MNTVYIHINETLNPGQQDKIGSALRDLPHVTDVELNTRQPHDVLVEYSPHRGMPMHILKRLWSLGLHADVMSC
jgi:hypothetical protein